VDSENLSQRMQRVAENTAAHGSIQRLLRVAARLCGGSYATVTVGSGETTVSITDGSPPLALVARHEVPLVRRDGKKLGSLVVLGATGSALDDGIAGALADVAELVVEQLEMRSAAELLAESSAKLEQSEQKFRQLIERAPDAVVVRRGERILYCNQAFLALYGYASHDEVAGRSIVDLVHETFRDELRMRIAAGDERPVTHRESRGVRKDGKTIAIEASTVRIDYDGTPAMLAFLRDCTARKLLEQQLLVTERMASVGTLAAGVAHEINNPLAFVLTNVDFARGQLPEGEAKTALEEAQKGAERVQRIVQSLKTLSSADEDRRGPVDVQHALELALSIAMNEIQQRAKLVRDFQPVPMVEASESRLVQVFLNLLVNAAHAIPKGAPEQHQIVVSTRTDAAGRVQIEVRDSGHGIAPDVLPRIFDPFFTTKPVGVGLGLGLAICHGIVSSLAGEVTVQSEPGRGATFRVAVPAVVEVAQEAEPEPASGPPSIRRGRVLVIDDEPMIGSSIRRVLSAHHDVELTTSGVEALQLIEGGARYDVILCDLMMPQMTGMDVFEQLRANAPEQAERMVFLTGGTFTERARTFVDERPTRVHHKPFRPAQLRELIARMLEA
jgi:PAS domain S-box-containing protein